MTAEKMKTIKTPQYIDGRLYIPCKYEGQDAVVVYQCEKEKAEKFLENYEKIPEPLYSLENKEDKTIWEFIIYDEDEDEQSTT